jgi:hypothetical protein
MVNLFYQEPREMFQTGEHGIRHKGIHNREREKKIQSENYLNTSYIFMPSDFHQPELLGFWTLSIIHYSENNGTPHFGNWIFLSPGEGETPEDRNRSTFPNVVFSSF